MTSVLDRAPGRVKDVDAAHEGVGTTRMRVIDSVPDAAFTILVWEFPPGSSEGAHSHADESIGLEHYLVVDGELVVTVDGAPHTLTAGDAVAVSRESVRGIHNASEAPAILHLVMEHLRA